MTDELIAGLDEVGWGSGAGPIISVVVTVRNKDLPKLPTGIKDSKKLSSIKRQALLKQLYETVTEFGVGCVDPKEVDELSPKWALQESYSRAIKELKIMPDVLYTDGKDGMNKVKGYKGKQIVMPKADALIKQVSIASIIAKEIRDSMMRDRAAIIKKAGLPDYGWAKNYGYLTVDHIEAIKNYGLLLGPEFYEHRRSYCEKFLGKIYGK